MHARRDVRVEPTDFEARRARIAFLRSWHELAAEGHVAARAVVAQPHIREEWAAYQRRVAAFE